MTYLYSSRVEKVRRDPKYSVAEYFLELMLEKDSFESVNSQNVLKELFSQLGIAGPDTIKKALSEYVYPRYLSEQGIARQIDDSIQDIFVARQDIQQNPKFLHVQNDILASKLPKMEDLGYFFGQFSNNALETIKRFQTPEFMRVCGIPMLAHWMRVGGTVKSINDFEPDNARRAFAAFKHDDVETGVPIVGLENYLMYVSEYIPEAISKEVILLTNHYDIYLNYIKDDFKAKNLDPTRKMVINALTKLKKNHKHRLGYVDKMIVYLRAYPDIASESRINVIDQVKKYFYEKEYLPELAKYATNNNQLFIVEDKMVDLLDNDNGGKKIPLGKYVNNISKQWSMVEVAEALNSDYYLFNRKVAELKNNAIVKARHLIIEDLLEKDMTLDFFYSTTAQILSRLKPVLIVPR